MSSIDARQHDHRMKLDLPPYARRTSRLPADTISPERSTMLSKAALFVRSDSAVAADMPLWRLNLMRVGYAVMGIGLAVVKWPVVFAHGSTTPLHEGVVAVLLTAMSLLAFLGLRYPVRLLPILLFEALWKLIWLSTVALPTALAGDIDPAMGEVMASCSLVIVILAVIPWRHVWQRFVATEGDPWRAAAGAQGR